MRLRFASVLLALLALTVGPVAAQPARLALANPPSARSVVFRVDRPAPPLPALGDRWLGPDKAKHFLASALLVLATQYVLEAKGGAGRRAALPLAIGTSAAAGFAKESYDARRARATDFSKKDLAADAAGIAAAVAVILW